MQNLAMKFLFTFFCYLFWMASLCLLSSSSRAAIARWDALPAIEVEHLQGAHVGQNVCPMCRHGYDAGILQFLPSNTPAAQARIIASALQTHLGDPRFRVFLILTDTAQTRSGPSPELLAAVFNTHPRWFVARLNSDDLAAASEDFQAKLDKTAIGYVFAQRRVIGSFTASRDPSTWSKSLQQLADYSRRFLAATYEQVNPSENPDSPKGQLWLAPNKLSHTLMLSKNAASVRVVCLYAQSVALADALVSVQQDHEFWARTDANGCVKVHGQMLTGTLVHAFVANQLMRVLRLDAISRNENRLELRNVPSIPAVRKNEMIVGLPCEGCEAVFQGLPSRLSWLSKLAPGQEPGERLLLSGAVRNSRGQPQAGVIIYAYQTNQAGHYPVDPAVQGAAARHGRLRGWVRTDAAGRYQFQTIRPASYPNQNIAQHIHMHVIEPGRCTYYLDDLVFSDDPKQAIASKLSRAARGGTGVVSPKKDPNGNWLATRDIELGLAIPGYEGCERRE